MGGSRRRRWSLLLPAVVAAVACGRSGAPGDESDETPTPTPTPTATLAFCSTSNVGLVACWTFESTFVDETSALVLSNSNTAFVAGAVGQGVAFSTSQASLTIEAASLPIGSASTITVEAWIHVDALPLPGERYGLADRQSPFSMFLYPNGVLRCGSRSLVYGSGAHIAASTWAHVACVDDGLETIAFVDGVRAGAGAGTALLFSPNTGTVRFGDNDPAGDDQLMGILDEVRVWSVALDSAALLESASRLER